MTEDHEVRRSKLWGGNNVTFARGGFRPGGIGVGGGGRPPFVFAPHPDPPYPPHWNLGCDSLRGRRGRWTLGRGLARPSARRMARKGDGVALAWGGGGEGLIRTHTLAPPCTSLQTGYTCDGAAIAIAVTLTASSPAIRVGLGGGAGMAGWGGCGLRSPPAPHVHYLTRASRGRCTARSFPRRACPAGRPRSSTACRGGQCPWGVGTGRARGTAWARRGTCSWGGTARRPRGRWSPWSAWRVLVGGGVEH